MDIGEYSTESSYKKYAMIGASVIVLGLIGFLIWWFVFRPQPESTIPKDLPLVQGALNNYFRPQSASRNATNNLEQYNDFVRLLPNSDWTAKMKACADTLSDDLRLLEMKRALSTLLVEFNQFLQLNGMNCILESLGMGDFGFKEKQKKGEEFINLIPSLVVSYLSAFYKKTNIDPLTNALQYDPVSKQVTLQGEFQASVKSGFDRMKTTYNLKSPVLEVDLNKPLSLGQFALLILLSQQDYLASSETIEPTFVTCSPCEACATQNINNPYKVS